MWGARAGAGGGALSSLDMKTIGELIKEPRFRIGKGGAAPADDAELRAFAARTLPMLEFHLQMARGLKSAAERRRKAIGPHDVNVRRRRVEHEIEAER